MAWATSVSIGWTRAHLSAADKTWLANLRLTRQVRDFTIVHATLDTPQQWGYVFSDLDAIARAGREICAALGREPASKVAQALKAKAA